MSPTDNPIDATAPTAGWSNWSGRQTSLPSAEFAPTTEADLQQAVSHARRTGAALRAVGASHSHSRVAATDGVLVRTDGWNGLVGVGPTPTDGPPEFASPTTATLRSGTRIYQIGPLLHPLGCALHNQGDIDQQSIAGATATGTHGTGPDLQSLSAGVTGVRLINADAEVVSITAADDPTVFEVARQSLGGVGLLTEVTVSTRPAYRLHERLWSEAPDALFDRIDALIENTRHFEFFWDPQRDRCAAKSLDETTAEPDPMPTSPRERIGWSHEIISSVRDERHTEMEYSVRAADGPACFASLREMVLRDFPALEWPIEYRTLAADDGWISTTGGHATVTISLHQDVSLDDRPLFEAAEAVFRSFGGRPHWGKVHYQSGPELAALYPRYGDWWAVRDRLDPDGIFLTTDLDRLRP